MEAITAGGESGGGPPRRPPPALERIKPDALLRPEHGRVVRSTQDDDSGAALVVGAGWSLRAVRW
ncbi:DUF5925 domain-containing protein, partial [Nocardia brasiliensis]|uniref:DUF5925 domain-containing protein n=1 Tax=Nocardia brasiliensis TaxID=37326 RepID=UPI00245458B0